MISAIILAAGQSKRIVKENKLLKIYKKKPLVNHVFNSVKKSNVDKIIIVLGHESIQVKKTIKKNKNIKSFFIFYMFQQQVEQLLIMLFQALIFHLTLYQSDHELNLFLFH